MTESEWLACTDPEPVLESLSGKASERKMRLFAAACCRRIWHLLDDRRSRRAVEVAERFADGLVDPQELSEANWRSAWWLMAGLAAAENAPNQALIAATNTTASYVHLDGTSRLAIEAGGPGEREPQLRLLRDIFGPLSFRPVALDPAWLAWNHGTVPALARRIYEEQAYHDLPILADALEDAGCVDEDILAHCRQPGEHVRGCWVVDLLLGKS